MRSLYILYIHSIGKNFSYPGLSFRPNPGPIKLNQPFHTELGDTLQLILCIPVYWVVLAMDTSYPSPLGCETPYNNHIPKQNKNMDKNSRGLFLDTKKRQAPLADLFFTPCKEIHI